MSYVVKEELERIARAHDGTLTPDLVVQAAKDKDSPLHPYFEWDVKKAAKECWLDQARQLIRSVRIVVTQESRKLNVPAYLRDPRMKHDEQGYISIPRLKTDDELSREAVVNEFISATGALRRARLIALSLNADATQIDELEQRCLVVQQSFQTVD